MITCTTLSEKKQKQNVASYFLNLLKPLVDLRKHPSVLPSLPLQLLPPLFPLILLFGLRNTMKIRGIIQIEHKFFLKNKRKCTTAFGSMPIKSKTELNVWADIKTSWDVHDDEKNIHRKSTEIFFSLQRG